MTSSINDVPASCPSTDQASLDNTPGSSCIKQNQRDDLAAWTDRMRDGTARTVNDEATRVTVARRLF